MHHVEQTISQLESKVSGVKKEIKGDDISTEQLLWGFVLRFTNRTGQNAEI
jgi:hypothetical protein